MTEDAADRALDPALEPELPPSGPTDPELPPFVPAAPDGPTPLVAGAWFGGALLWVSSVLLVFDELRAFNPGGGAVLWAHGAGIAWYGAAQLGAAARKGQGGVVRRAAAILGVGIAMLAAAAVLIGILGPGSARPAYVLLGLLGMGAFFLAQWHARRTQPRRIGRGPTLVAAAEAAAVVFTFIVYTLG